MFLVFFKNGVVTWFYEEEECSEITELHGSTNISAAVFNAHKTFGFSSKLYCEVSSAASEEFCRAEIVTDDSGEGILMRCVTKIQ